MLGQLLEIIGASLSEQLWLFLSQRCHFIRNLSLLRSKLLASPNSINCYIVLPSIFCFFQDFKVFFFPPRFSKILKQVLQCYPISRVSHQTQVLMVSSEARNRIKLQNDHQKPNFYFQSLLRQGKIDAVCPVSSLSHMASLKLGPESVFLF